MTASLEPALDVRGLVKRYGDHTAVRGIDLTAHRGAVTALLGPNGAGKTTTVECCVGLRTPDDGSVRLLGRPATEVGADDRARVGVMLQDGGLPNQARPLELLRHLSRLYAAPVDVNELAARLGIDQFAGTAVRGLSGGQRQRVALAAALVGRPELVFLDEPSAGLDPQARHTVWDVVRELCTQGVAVLLTTHDMEEATRLASHVVIVDDGRVVAQGTPADLTSSYGTSSIRFTAAPNLGLDELRLSLSPALSVSETRPGEYVIAGDVDPAVVATVTAWCADQGLMPDQLAVGRASLEDVFLDLTGRALR